MIARLRTAPHRDTAPHRVPMLRSNPDVHPGMTTSIFTVATLQPLVLGIVGVSLLASDIDKPYSLVAQAMLDASRRGTRTS